MTPAELGLLARIVAALGGLAAKPIKNKLDRNETVIRLLKQFGFEFNHPPADFQGVYAYALVEYGVGKPPEILELFRQDAIRKAFREAFEQDDPSILLKEGQHFIDGYALGDRIKDSGIELFPEFAVFASHFLDVSKKTRNPAEVARDQKLDNLQRGVIDIQDKLGRFTSPQDLLLELALQAQNYQVLQPTNPQSIAKVQKYILDQQVKTWFMALKYEIENYRTEGETYFEIIINIPARRGYDRILVRGVEGEAKLADIAALKRSVNEQKTKEGWLIAARRISPAAHKAAKSKENEGIIFCYTFDELLDQDADFDKYLDWLESEVKRRGIDKMYVPLACSKDEFDPLTKEKIGISEYSADDGWIEGYIDRWIHDPSKEHISILGEFGTGKTWLTLHYAWTALQKYKTAKEQGIERPRIPLVIPLRDYAKAVSVESLFSEFFFRKYEIPLPGYSVFEQLNRMGKLLLIFDGFDEMADRVDSQKMINNFWELARVVVPGSKAILTCRTEHFPEAKEGRALLNAELKASVSALSGEPPQFEVLELKKFSEEQIRQVLSFKTNEAVVEEIMGNSQLLDLASRPVMTELILEALPEIEAGKPIDMSRVYLYAVREKMKRDIKAERTFTSLADKLYFLCELSWEMLSTNQMSINYRLFPDRIRRLFGYAVQEQKNLDHWHYDMMGQTMLIRNADGDYMPAHRSLLEFFVAYKFAAELGILAPDFLEMAQDQSHLITNEPSNYTWSSYFQRQCDEAGEVSFLKPLKNFSPEAIELLAETLGKEPLVTRASDEIRSSSQTAILNLMMKMLDQDKESVKEKLIPLIKKTKYKLSDAFSVVGGNVASILCRHVPTALKSADLEGVNLNYTDFYSADLTGCNLENSRLENISINGYTLMQDVSFKNAYLGNINITLLRGWISAMPLTPTRSMRSPDDVPAIRFYYSGKEISEDFGSSYMIQNGEILIACVHGKKEAKWTRRIRSVFILNYRLDSRENLLRMLTVEGNCINIDTLTGNVSEDPETPLLTWKNADLEGVGGLSDRDAYVLKVLGAINSPESNYNPRNDEKLNRNIRRGTNQSAHFDVVFED